jgi:hypothetical protein
MSMNVVLIEYYLLKDEQSLLFDDQKGQVVAFSDYRTNFAPLGQIWGAREFRSGQARPHAGVTSTWGYIHS